jgi:hypothetical protein
MMIKLIEWFKVVARAPLMWLTVLAGVLTIAADELASVVGAEHPAVAGILTVVSWIVVGVQMIRRSTPVLAQARGVLPVSGPVTSTEQHLERELVQLRDVMQAHIEGQP